MTNISSKQPRSSVISEVKSLILVVAIASIIRILIIGNFYVPTGSMKATILEGDYIIATNYSYGYSRYSLPMNLNLFSGRILASAPQRGDIVIFYPPADKNVRYIKRLVGLPGDKIQIVEGIVHINDRAVPRIKIGDFIDEQGQKYTEYQETLPNGVTYHSYNLKKNITESYDINETSKEFYVPTNHYFFLGDNRDNSNDSRTGLGYVPFENFLAKGRFILFSAKEPLWVSSENMKDKIARIWLWLKSIRLERTFNSIYL